MVIFLAIMAAAGFYVFNEAVANDAAVRVGKDFVTVPDVQGSHKDTARRKVEDAGLSYSESIPMLSAKIQRDYVILQRPEPGNVVRAGRRVFVTLSQGQESFIVPDLKGKTEAQARDAVAMATLTVGPSIARLPSNAVPGTVIGQDPVAGQSALRSATVSLLVSEGQQTSPRVLVPNLIGLTRAAAATALEEYGLTMRIVPDTSADAPIGTIVKQEPENGMELARGGAVVVSERVDEEAAIVLHEAVLRYTVPPGFGERSVEITVIDEFETRYAGYPQTGSPPKLAAGFTASVPLKYPNSVTAEVYLGGTLVRRYFYDGDNPPQITNY